MRSFAKFALPLLAALAIHPAAAGAAVTLDPVAPAGTFTSPIFVTSDPADPDRLFVVERGGLIKVTENGTTSVFADLTSLVTCCAGERGLLSMAPAPSFPETGEFFVYYTEVDDRSTAAVDELGDIRVDELTASGGTATVASDRKVLEIDHSAQSNHNGGQLQWGPDGYLYIGVGDGGGGGDPFHTGQSNEAMLGKILRINPYEPGTGAAYQPSPTNPFASGPGLDEIFAYGLRNPWRFSFDRSTGDLLIGDVGQNLHEEIDYAPAATGHGLGANFGWSCREGLSPYAGSDPACATASGFTDPILDYPHSDPGGGAPYGCSITGGYVVRDASLPSLYGRYIYADFCGGALRSLTPALPAATDDRDEGLSVGNPQSFGEDACGRVYVAESSGTVARLTGDAPATCNSLDIKVVGSGRVTGGGIDCPGRCHVTYQAPLPIRLSANAGGTRVLVPPKSWSGDCAGSSSVCTFEMDRDRAITVAFPEQSTGGGRSPKLALRARHRRVPWGARVRLVARVKPCTKSTRGRRVRLLRDGVPFATKIVHGNCVLGFGARITHEHRFRAALMSGRGNYAALSAKVRVGPRPGSSHRTHH